MTYVTTCGWRRLTAASLGLAVLSGCATLPSSGPTGRQIAHAIAASGNEAIRIVEVGDIETVPAPTVHATPLVEQAAPATDLVGPGDVLDVAIYEAGVTLFGSGGAASLAGVGFDPSAKVERLPPNRVDDAGDIQIPFGGRLHVAGRTTSQIEQQIRRSLAGMSQNPQVLVAIRENITNSVIVGGEVTRPGRLVLSTNRETLADAIALAGGYRGDAKDLSVRVLRQNVDGEFRLGDVVDGSQRATRVYPGDRISVVRSPRSFSVLGAPGQVSQLPFSATRVSLAEAIATAGGANPNLGDAKAIFVFRIAPDETGVERNTVYHIDMMKAGSYFLAQRFAMRDKDILYVGNARANQPSKLIQIISQLFAPIVTVTNSVRTVR